jgi:hypothetical protein
MLRRIAWYKFTDVYEVLAASIVREIDPSSIEDN